MDWKDHLKPEEADRLAELKAQDRASSKERRRIFDRCRKRAAFAAKKETARG